LPFIAVAVMISRKSSNAHSVIVFRLHIPAIAHLSTNITNGLPSNGTRILRNIRAT
jgi:hypothetical protein